MAVFPSPTGAGDLNGPPPQPPASQPPSPGAGMGTVAAPASAGLSAVTFSQEVLQTVTLVKDSLTHLVALLPPIAPFVAQLLDQLVQMVQGIVQQSAAGPPDVMGGGAQPAMAMMPPQGAGAPPPGM